VTPTPIESAPPRGLPEFDLLESLLWEEGRGFYLLGHHIERMRRSAAALGFDFPAQRLDSALGEFDGVARQGRHKVRVLLSRGGEFVVESARVASLKGGRVALARRAIPREAPLLRHKTTYRKLYSDLLQDQVAHEPGIVDVILWDDTGYVTESGVANVVIELRGNRYTPSLQQELLPGVFRRSLLEQGVVGERQITLAELHEADAVFLVNSVRGWMPLDPSGRQGVWSIRSDFSYSTPLENRRVSD
jgi:para-aminobenzoate synthetase/4-amino-4-deoxychorismate lyase